MADAGMDDAFDAFDAGQSSSHMLADATAIIRLARMDTLEYARQRKAEAKALGISVAALDKEVQAHRRSMHVQTVAAAGKPWLAHCQFTQQGEVRGNLVNAFLPMRDDPRVSHLVRYDEMERLTILMQPIPGVQIDGNTNFEPRPIRDADFTAIQEWLQREGLETVGGTTTRQAVEARAREMSFHPVIEWLDTLEWDGQLRLSTWLTKYLGVALTPYTQAIGTYFLTSMIARVRRPGCKCDYALVLEGPQGARKSTACAILGGNYFSDSLPDIRGGKDVSQHLNGKWLIEVAEMSALDKAEAAALKAFITRRVERYRPSYGHAEVKEDRQCVFVGTTNKTAYLRDETGGRRFWPVTVGAIDTDALARDRAQLFAEADAWFQDGNAWWPDSTFEATYIAPEQSARYEQDAWEDKICTWLDTLHDFSTTIVWNEKAMKEPRCTVLMVACLALHMAPQDVGTSDQRRIGAALERLGWVQGPRKNDGRFYEPGPKAIDRAEVRKAERQAAAKKVTHDAQ